MGKKLTTTNIIRTLYREWLERRYSSPTGKSASQRSKKGKGRIK